jgi:nucleoside-diphosphate-sugar epimerase
MKVLITGSSGFIGSALLRHLVKKGLTVKGIDIQEPRYREHFPLWEKADILDIAAMRKVFSDFQPTHLVHLAARTDLGLDSNLDCFKANTVGVKNILEICMESQSLQMAVFASTILVAEVGYLPKADDDYHPTTPYGESKVMGEKIIRGMPETANFTWCIIRPTSIWGPGYGSHYINLFLTIAKGRYFHPGKANNLVTYGYIGNCVYQIEKLLYASPDEIDNKTFFIGDYWQTRLKEWVQMIHQQLGRVKVYTLPDYLIRIIAYAGDVLWKYGWKNVPMTTFRLRNMLTDRLYETKSLEAITGELPYSQESAVQETISWLRENGEI